MPIVYYTEQEYNSAIMKVEAKAMKLSQDLCEATEYPCILGPNASIIGGKGEYCDECPAEPNCPYQWKKWSQ